VAKKLPTIESLGRKYEVKNEDGTLSEVSWVELTLSLYSVGASDEEVITDLRITEETFRKLYGEDDYFKAVIDHGRLASYAWWQKWGRTNLFNKLANYSGWYMQMKNKFGWADRQQQSIVDGEFDNMSDGQISRILEEIKERGAKSALKVR
jgi:hypothetical protein